MNGDEEQLLRRLEQATAPRAGAEPSPDALRETWLVFTALLEKADAASEPPRVRTQTLQRPRRWVVWCAVAASLLAAVGIFWSGRQTAETLPVARVETSPATAPAIPAADLADLADLAWEDEWDEEVVDAHDQVELVQHEWTTASDPFQLAYYAVSAAQWRWENDSL